MPRRTEPIFGREEIVEVRPFEIPEEAKATLLEHLGTDRESSPAASRKLDALGTHYTTWRAQEEDRPKRRGSLAALHKLKGAATRLGETGSSMDRSTVHWMLLGLCDHADVPFRLALADLHHQAGLDGDEAFLLSETVLDRADLIAAAAQQAHDQLSAQRGPDRDNT